MQEFFKPFKASIIGEATTFQSPYHPSQPIVYADWTASGRCYKPIEELLLHKVLPFVANTHTETNTTGKSMTIAYHKALKLIKKHVNANENDAIISTGSGMTGAVNKFQRILGFRLHERFKERIQIPTSERPIIFVTHMEHHSNQTSWLETIAEVEIIEPTSEGLVDLKHFATLLEKYKDRAVKIAAVTSCSNVTGVFTPYHDIAEMIHQAGGFCFVDFACSAPYIDIDMHPTNPQRSLDAIFFSPHKFLGGPGTTGILIFNKNLYTNKIPDTPGGGTVEWTNPWKSHRYIDDIEQREDGGTPAFLQTIKVALAIKLKEQMGVPNIHAREQEMNEIVWNRLGNIPNLHILADNIKERLSIFSFYIDGLHFNLAVKLLNDRFGIQVRGGCSCAGTYGHYLLNIQNEQSNSITQQIDAGDYTNKPGWIRMSLHPTMTNEEVQYIADAIVALAANHSVWGEEYTADKYKQFSHQDTTADKTAENVASWFEL